MPAKNDDEKKPRGRSTKGGSAKGAKGSNKAGGTRKARAAQQGARKSERGAAAKGSRGRGTARKATGSRKGRPEASSTGSRQHGGRSGSDSQRSTSRSSTTQGRSGTKQTQGRGGSKQSSGRSGSSGRAGAAKGAGRRDDDQAQPKRSIPKGFGPYLRSEPERTRRPDEEVAPRRPAPLRTKGVRGNTARPVEAGRKTGRVGRARRLRKGAPTEVRDEVFKLGGRRAQRLFDAMTEAAAAFAEGRDRDAARILKPVRDEIPKAASVRELYGLALYRSGRYAQAEQELEAFVALTGSVEQHPVLMDCARAQRDRKQVQVLWEELGSVSPSSALMTEGRIVLAGSMADGGDIRGAIELLEKKQRDTKRPQEHHARLWYTIGDLYERAGDLAQARSWFLKVRSFDPGYADVAERLAALR